MRRSGTIRPAVSAAFGTAILLTACVPLGPVPSAGPPSTPPAAGTSAPASPPATGTRPPSDPSAADWKHFTTPDGRLTFDHPAEWTIKDRAAEAAAGGVFVEVLSDAGRPVASLRTNLVTGSECREKYPYALFDSEELPALTQAGQTPRFVFEGRADPGAGAAGSSPLAYGITSAPEPSGPTACPIFHYFTWPPSGAMFGGVYNPFDASPGNPAQVDTPEAYTETSEYEDIRMMITSLRPAGK